MSATQKTKISDLPTRTVGDVTYHVDEARAYCWEAGYGDEFVAGTRVVSAWFRSPINRKQWLHTALRAK